jgi:Ca2+-binding RTX toxin-like protein
LLNGVPKSSLHPLHYQIPGPNINGGKGNDNLIGGEGKGVLKCGEGFDVAEFDPKNDKVDKDCEIISSPGHGFSEASGYQ